MAIRQEPAYQDTSQGNQGEFQAGRAVILISSSLSW